jgi:hypothetical protein
MSESPGTLRSALIAVAAAVAAGVRLAALPATGAASGPAKASWPLVRPYKHVIYIQYDKAGGRHDVARNGRADRAAPQRDWRRMERPR